MKETPEDMAARLAAVLKAKRTDAGFSHEQLAVKAGLDRSTISLYESGKRVPTITSALRIAQALNMPLSDMFQKSRGDGNRIDPTIAAYRFLSKAHVL